ncbi:MAG: ABC transporter ATP-binding protein [Nocardioides sp.]
MTLLDVHDLQVWFDLPEGGRLHAVQGIDLAVDRGQRLGLVGESGCGKTTAMMALMGLLPPNATVSGEVLLDGLDLLRDGEASMRPHRWVDVAMVFQGAMNAFNPVKPVGVQITEPMELHGTASGGAARRRAGELLETVGIPASAAKRFPHEFSGGMRQRAALAMALACDPKVLFADEPTTALDVMVQAQILELLVGLSERLGLALVLVTHDLPVVAQACDLATVMYAGRVAESGTVDELFHTPRHPYTELLFAATPDLLDEQDVVSIPGSPPRLDRPLEGCGFAARCPQAMPRCTTEAPALVGVDGRGHTAACHLNDHATDGVLA